MTLLRICTLLLPVLAVAFAAECLIRRSMRRVVPLSEWLERYRALDSKQPLRGPKYRNKEMRMGAAGVSRPEIRAKVQPVEIRKRAR